MTNVFDTLKSRGFVYQTSNEVGIKKLLSQPGATIYCGFDPSAPSFQLGSLIPLMLLHHLQAAGHKIIVLIGGGTGKVGDPTDKAKARAMLDPKTVAANRRALKSQLEKIGVLTFKGSDPAQILDNNEWLSKFKFLDEFLLGIAKYFSVNELVSLETFKKRLASKTNLSLMEFCYPALQAWDFLHLFEKDNCQLQIGGSDQWSNILAGVNLIKRRHRREVFGLTVPLLTTASGAKMGKSEKGAVWLDPQRTTPFEMYQYLIGVDDQLVSPMFKLLTTLPLENIAEIEKGHPREAQEKLAFELTQMVHGEKAARQSRTDSQKLFGWGRGEAENIPRFTAQPSLPLEEILVKSNSLPSKSEVRRRVQQGGVSIDGKTVTDPKMLVSTSTIVKFGRNRFLKIQCK